MNSRATYQTLDDDEPQLPKKPPAWERIESQAPLKSDDSDDQLAALWQCRYRAIVAIYREVGIELENNDLIVYDILELMKSQDFGCRSLPLGALLGPRWGRLEKALGRWLATTAERLWQHLPYVLDRLDRDLGKHTDEEIRRAWERSTGYAVPCPPISLIRRFSQ